MGKVSVLNDTKRPDSIALITAIEGAIDEIASDKMTPIEVLGVLDVVSKRFFDERLRIE